MRKQTEKVSENQQRVFVYTGPGTSQELNPCLLNFYEHTHSNSSWWKRGDLKNILPENTQTAAGAEAGSSDDTIKKGDLLVIGAGNARMIVKNYNVKSNSQNQFEFSHDLNKILDKGVHYSGICAGAIVACSHFTLLADKDSLSTIYSTNFTLGMINATAGFQYHTDGHQHLTTPSQSNVFCEVQSFYSYPTESYNNLHAFFYGFEPQPRKMDLLTLNTSAFFKNKEHDASTKILASFHRDQSSTLDQPYNADRNHREHPIGIFSKPATPDSPAIFASAPHY